MTHSPINPPEGWSSDQMYGTPDNPSPVIPRGFCGRTEVHPGHGQCDGFTDADAMSLDVALYGNAYMVDGKRVPPEDVVHGSCCANIQDGYGHHSGCPNSPRCLPADTRDMLTLEPHAVDVIREQMQRAATGVIPGDDFACCRNGEHLPAIPGPEASREFLGTSYPLHATQAQQDDLVEEIAGLLEEAMHLEACWISEDETRCVCIIHKLQALLPRCGHVETVGTKGLTRQCLRTVHPSVPYKHTFGTV